MYKRTSVAVQMATKNKYYHEILKARLDGTYKAWEMSLMDNPIVSMRGFMCMVLKNTVDSAC